MIESIGEGAKVGCNTVPNASYPEWSGMMSGYEMFLGGKSSGETGTLIGLSCVMGNTDGSQPYSRGYVESEKSLLVQRYSMEYDRRILPEQGDGQRNA